MLIIETFVALLRNKTLQKTEIPLTPSDVRCTSYVPEKINSTS